MADDRSGAERVTNATSSRGLAGKRDYVRSLEQRRDEAALGLLVECLCDESGYLRELAEAALLRIGERSGPALLPLLGQGLWFSRTSAARVLGSIGYAPAAGPLLQLTGDSVGAVVREAVAALVAIGQRGGSARVAWELHRLPLAERDRRLARLLEADRDLGERLARLLRLEELMSLSDPAALRDDSPRVRAGGAGGAGGAWDAPAVLTGTPGAPGPTAPALVAAHGADAAAR
jgi:HEAT repeat protein